jgi:hypothetical protein
MKNDFTIPRNAFILHDNVAIVELTQGQVCLIDANDLPLIAPYKWFFLKGGYAYANTKTSSGARAKLYMHRLILGLSDPSVHCDHQNHDGLDNRRTNLRAASRKENMQNQILSRRNTSGFKGVKGLKKSGTFQARIGGSKNRQHLGSFNSAIEAARAYDTAARRLHGEFASLNFPSPHLSSE